MLVRFADVRIAHGAKPRCAGEKQCDVPVEAGDLLEGGELAIEGQPAHVEVESLEESILRNRRQVPALVRVDEEAA